MEDFNPMESLKLNNYINIQSENLTFDEMKYIDDVNLNDLMLQSEYKLVKKEVERYNYLKGAMTSGEVDMILATDEMERLRNNVYTQVGQDIDMIDLSKLNVVTKIENILKKSGIKSKNDLTVRFEEGPYENNSSYIRMVLCNDNSYVRYGVKAGSRMAISTSGRILVPKASIYNKMIF